MLRAFHGDPKIKQVYIDRVKAHQLADEISQGLYWQDGKGCAVGCTIHGDDHSKYETELGISSTLAYLQDSIFEGLPNDEAKTFPLEFLESIPVGADLSLVWPRFAHWLLLDPEDGVTQFSSHESIQRVGDLYQRVIEGETVSTQQWAEAARAAAEAAGATWATWATWAAAAVETAEAARDARAAARAARDAARAAARASQRKKLIELLKTAPVGVSA